MKRGVFITFEGVEGAGKSTSVQFAEQFLNERGVEVVATREPGGTPMAEEIRDTLLRVRAEEVSQSTELLLMFAARAQHVEEVIRPSLSIGKWVLCDRFTDATVAYQGGGRSVSLDVIDAVAKFVHGDIVPDCTFFLDIPIERTLERIRSREQDRFEQEDIDFFQRVRSAYLELAQQEQRFVVLNADREVGQVQADLIEHLAMLIRTHI